LVGRFRRSKRGQWMQFILLVVVVLALGMVYLAMGFFSNQINDELQLDASFSNQSKLVSQTHVDSQGSVFDSSILIIIAGLWLLCLALAYNSKGSPLLLVVALFVVMAMGFVGMILSNTWEEFPEDEPCPQESSPN